MLAAIMKKLNYQHCCCCGCDCDDFVGCGETGYDDVVGVVGAFGAVMSFPVVWMFVTWLGKLRLLLNY